MSEALERVAYRMWKFGEMLVKSSASMGDPAFWKREGIDPGNLMTVPGVNDLIFENTPEGPRPVARIIRYPRFSGGNVIVNPLMTSIASDPSFYKYRVPAFDKHRSIVDDREEEGEEGRHFYVQDEFKRNALRKLYDRIVHGLSRPDTESFVIRLPRKFTPEPK